MSSPTQSAVSPAFDSYLLEVADAVNTTLDLNTLLQRVAEMLKRVIDYEIFAILLLNEKTQELRVRFQVGHPPEVAERIRIKVGQGVTGQAVLRREPVLVNDVSAEAELHQLRARRAFRAGSAADRQEQGDRRPRRRSRPAQRLHRGAQAPAHAVCLAHRSRHRERAALHPGRAPGAATDAARPRSVAS